MDILVSVFNTVLLQPFVNFLLFLIFVFQYFDIPGALGFSIIILTLILRLVMQPFYSKQLSMAKKMEEVKPHLDKLSKKHKGDKARLQKEQMKLYQEMGINPASGCLLALIQIPIFIALYQVLILFLQNENGLSAVAKAVNKYVYFNYLKITSIDPAFFGYNLAIAPSSFSKYGVHYLIIPVITAILQYYQVKATAPQVKTKPESKKDEKGNQDFQQAMATQMKFMFPVMIGYFSYILPVGLSIYWNMFSLFSLTQKKPK